MYLLSVGLQCIKAATIACGKWKQSALPIHTEPLWNPWYEAADQCVTATHRSLAVCRVLYFKADISSTVRPIPNEYSTSLWTRPDYHHPQLYFLDLHQTLRVPCGTARRTEGVLHCLRLIVTYTRAHFHRTHSVESPDYAEWETSESVPHLFCECLIY